MKVVIAVLVCLMPLLTFGQSPEPKTLDTIGIQNFGLGLNTAFGDFSVPPGAARICHNVDLSAGDLQIRDGYDSIYTFPGADSIIGLYSLYYSDGRQRLVAVVDSDGTGYANVYVSNVGTSQFGTSQDSFKIVIDTNAIRTTELPLNPFSYPFCWYDTIWVGGTSYKFCIPMNSTFDDSVLIPHWYVDTLVAAINGSACSSYVTAYDRGDSMVVKEDDTNLQVRYATTRAHEVITEYKEYTTAPNRIASYFSAASKPSFATFQDNLYIANGDSRGIVWDGNSTRNFPPKPPGVPTITPLNTSGNLDGEYRYLFSVCRNLVSVCDSGGVFTDPVRVHNGTVLMRNFPWMQADTVTNSPDSIAIYIYRTRANPGRADQRDSVFYVGHLLVDTLPSTLDTLTFIDTTSDINLGTGRPLIDEAWVGRDSLGNYAFRYGAPTLMASTFMAYNSQVVDTATTPSDVDTLIGIFGGIPKQRDTLGVAYVCTFIDTVTGIESDTGRSLIVFNDSLQRQNDSLMKSVTVGLPRIPNSDSGLVINLYRGLVYQVTTDTGDYYYLFDSTATFLGELAEKAARGNKWIAQLSVDSVVITDFHLVAQIPASDTLYTDSVRYDSLHVKQALHRQSPPYFIDKIFTYDGRMFGAVASRLYMSRLDSAYAWGLFDFVSANEGDGDAITAIWPARTAMRVFKNFSNYNVYDDYGKPEIVGRWGCIAPFSHTAGALHYYLSTRGIEGESDGQYLERTVNNALISGFLDNFDTVAVTSKRDMVAAYLPEEQTALFCLGDTTYAFFERAYRRNGGYGGWATWDLKFAGGCLYDTETDIEFVPGKTFYFFGPGSQTINSFGTSITDNGDSILMTWQSGPISVDRMKSQIKDVGLWCKSGDTSANALTITILDEDGNAVDSAALSDLSSARYRLKQLPVMNPMLYYSIKLHSNVGISNTIIDRIDFTEEPIESQQPE